MLDHGLREPPCETTRTGRQVAQFVLDVGLALEEAGQLGHAMRAYQCVVDLNPKSTEGDTAQFRLATLVS